MDRSQLGPEERSDLIHAKNGIRCGAHRQPADQLPEVYRRLNFHPFENEKRDGKLSRPEPLPDPQRGYEYVACDVGRDQERGRGAHRLVFECHKVSNDWGAIYYTDEHYAKFSFSILEGR